MSELVIDLEEVQATARALKACELCHSGRGLLIDGADWDVIQLHDPECIRLVKGHGLRVLQGGVTPVPPRPTAADVHYNQLWSIDDKKVGRRYLRIQRVGNSRAEGYTWREGECGGRVTRIYKHTIAAKWTLCEDQSGGAA